MGKKVISLMLLLITFSLVGCGTLSSKSQNNNLVKEVSDTSSEESNNKLAEETKSDYVVIQYSGGEIVDIWTLENSDLYRRWNSNLVFFTDDDGNYISVSNNVTIIECKEKETFKKYEEYHKVSLNN